MTESSESQARSPPAGPTYRPEAGYWALVWSVALAALGYLVFSAWFGWRDVVAAAARVGLFGLTACLLLSLVNYGLRFVRWQAYLAAMGYDLPWKPSLRIYLTGFALTTTPGKTGETIRSVLLQRHGVPYPASLAAFVSERLSDLLAVVLLALLGLSAYPPARGVVAIGAAMVIIGLVFLTSGRLAEALERRLTGTSRSVEVLRHAFAVLREARTCHRPKLLGFAAILGVIAWAAEAWAFHLMLGWMNADVDLIVAVCIYAVSMLGGALSFMPGGLGGAEAIMVAMLLWQGLDGANAVAATVLIRVATLWFAVILGLGAAAVPTARTTSGKRH